TAGHRPGRCHLRGAASRPRLRRDADRIAKSPPNGPPRGTDRPMPTAAKLVAAIGFGFVAWFASALMVPYLPPNARLGWFHELAAVVGALMGWTMSGARAGGGIA